LLAPALAQQVDPIRCYQGTLDDSEDEPKDWPEVPATEKTSGIVRCLPQKLSDSPACFKVRIGEYTIVVPFCWHDNAFASVSYDT